MTRVVAGTRNALYIVWCSIEHCVRAFLPVTAKPPGCRARNPVCLYVIPDRLCHLTKVSWSRYWRFSTARRSRPPPRAAGAPVGAPAAQLHTQLGGLRRKAAARRSRQPASSDATADSDPAGRPAPAAAQRHAATSPWGPQPSPSRAAGAGNQSSPAAAADHSAAASGAAHEARSMKQHGAAPSASTARRAPGAAAAGRAPVAPPGDRGSVEARGGAPPRARARRAQRPAGDQAGALHAPLSSTDGLHAARPGGDGGLRHVVRCAREFLADVRGQRLSNNAVASALQARAPLHTPRMACIGAPAWCLADGVTACCALLQGLGARIAHAAVPATPLVTCTAGLAPEPAAYREWAGAAAGGGHAHGVAQRRTSNSNPGANTEASRRRADADARTEADERGQARGQGDPAHPSAGQAARPHAAAPAGMDGVAEQGRPDAGAGRHAGAPPQGAPSAAPTAAPHVSSQLAGLKRRAALRRSEV